VKPGQHLTLSKLLRFALVGVAATGVQYLVAALLFWGVGWPAVWASGLGFVVSAVGNFLANAMFTFGVRDRLMGRLPRFAVVAGTGLALNSAVLALAQRNGLHVLLAQLLATLLVLAWNFVLNAVWSFRVNANG